MEATPDTEKESEGETTAPVTAELVEAVQTAISEDRPRDVAALIEPLHVADLGELVECLDRDDRVTLVERLGPELDPEVLPYLERQIREDLIDQMGTEQAAQALLELDTDDAVQVMEDLDEEARREILEAIPEDERLALESGLAFPEDSAGRLMNRAIVMVPQHWTVGEVIDFLRASEELPNDFYTLFAVGPDMKPTGYTPLSRVLRNRRPVRLTDVMETDMRLIPSDMDQEEVAHMFRQYGLVEAACVDGHGRLLGVITVDDIVDVIDEEAEEDLMRLGGVTGTDRYAAVWKTVKARFSWLIVNLCTAVTASGVIAIFDATIEAIVALAVLMPIVASMGGNAGTQTLTVVVRALATKDIRLGDAWRLILKETVVGLLNGMLFALVAGGLAWAWAGDPSIGLIFGAALIVTMLFAGLAGAGIPMLLHKLKIDPAVASGVFLTTVTDVIGFFSFLGLAAYLLL